MPIRIATAALTALALAACTSAGPSSEATPDSRSSTPSPSPSIPPTATETPSPTTSPTNGHADFVTCENPELAYHIGHPPEWWANEAVEGAGAAADIPPCQYFAPTPVGLEPGTDDLGGIAIRFDIGAGDTTPSGEVLRSRALAVDGRAAIAEEVEVPPQAGFVPEGSVAYRYLVELDSGETLMAIADNINVDQATYEDAIEVLDDMMETIEIGTPPA